MGFALRKARRDKASPVAIIEHNPYLVARREWDERYGDLISRARNWRTMALLSGLVALVATVAVVWLSARSRVIPFVVLMDSLGRPVASGIVGEGAGVGERLYVVGG